MKTLISLFLLISPVIGSEGPQSFKKLFSLEGAHWLVFVTELPTATDDFHYKPYGEPIKIDAKLFKVLKTVEQAEVKKQFAPFVGVLGKVAVIDKDDNPICILGVINWNSTFSVTDVRKHENKLLSGKKGIYKQGRSVPFSRWMYSLIKQNSPEKIVEFNKMYKDHGKTLEGLLFGGKDKK